VGDKTSASLTPLLQELSPADRDRGLSVLRNCEAIEVEAGVPLFTTGFPADALLLVERGFVVLRATAEGSTRSVVTCEAGPGGVLLPPAAAEVLVGLGTSRLTVIDARARAELLQVPALAGRLVEQLAVALGRKQQATANFAPTRHIDRVRQKMLQLAGGYGHVVREGIRIDFPVSHALLAEMIGSSRETVTRAVDQLQRAGFLDRRGSTYRLLISPESVFAQPRP
jgi:CRP-like cAMP-binding protein